MKKKWISILFFILIATSLIACGINEKDTEAVDNENIVQPEAQVETLELVVAHNQTSPENPYYYGMEAFKETVEELSAGQIKVTVYNGTLSQNESDLIEKLQAGEANMVLASPGFMTKIGVPEVDMFSLLYLFDDFDHWSASLDGEFGDSMKKIINEKTDSEFKVMDYWSASVRDVYAKQPISTPSEAVGLKIRTQNSKVQQEFWQKIGAIPVSTNWGEVYQALLDGTIDGAENDYTNLMLKDHHKTENGKYISETHHDYATRLLLMNGKFYESLTDQQKAWIDEAVEKATFTERKVTFDKYNESKQKVIADGGIITENKDMDIENFKEVAIPIQDEFAKQYNLTDQLKMIREIKY